MNAFDRIETRMPQLMDELAPAPVPDYFDDMLRQTARTRQRPAWSALERWLPMGTIAQVQPARQIPWRLVAVAALLLVAFAAAIALYAGSRRPTAPPPFGPANNGDVLISSNGDIVAVDVATGATRAVVATAALEQGPDFAPDGRSFVYELAGSEGGFWVANADGSNQHRVFDTTGYDVSSVEWSQSGDRLVIVGAGTDSRTFIALVDPAGGEPLLLRPAARFSAGAMPFGRDQLVLDTGVPGGPISTDPKFWLMNVKDPANVRPLAASPFALNPLALSPDGTKLVYANWQDGVGVGMNLHILDLASNTDRLVSTVGSEAYGWQHPEFLPDGTSILTDQWDLNGKYQLAIVPADGGPSRAIGPVRTQQGGASMRWLSPDGKTVLASYHDDGVSDGKVWRINVATGAGTELTMPEPDDLSWQRVAP